MSLSAREVIILVGSGGNIIIDARDYSTNDIKNIVDSCVEGYVILKNASTIGTYDLKDIVKNKNVFLDLTTK